MAETMQPIQPTGITKLFKQYQYMVSRESSERFLTFSPVYAVINCPFTSLLYMGHRRHVKIQTYWISQEVMNSLYINSYAWVIQCLQKFVQTWEDHSIVCHSYAWNYFEKPLSVARGGMVPYPILWCHNINIHNNLTGRLEQSHE